VSRTRVSLERRVASVAEEALAAQKFVSPVDVLVGLGWLPPTLLDFWRNGRSDCVEGLGSVSAHNLAEVLASLGAWAEARGLTPGEVTYTSGSLERRPLRFTREGDLAIERLCRTHWSSPDLSAAARERITQRASRAPDLVVISPLKDWTCSTCGFGDGFLVMDDPGPICLTCADMDHLVYLPAGDAALTRRAKKASGLSAVVIRFSRTRRRYERQGILVEGAALEQAERECLADEDARARRRERAAQRREREDDDLASRMAAEISRLFPGCPPERASAIARHTATRGSGRVGRTAAGRSLDVDAVTSAVVASVRHEDTSYDRLLMSGVAREDARDRVREKIDQILDAWRA
jgi:hypothetical protein